ncbi:hypothetical protein Ahy_B08g092629 [Arachis hypogaea]|uniref:Uncharacterized protein n=1 Tax=Arachis hypogaea TaxID=3818 RepID=A0A444Y4B3_ARAHY|nr:hypothetical protein Ahy_B08g092629 [Arachis hypogaea]
MLHWRDCDTQIRTMVKIVHIFTEISISLNFSLRPKSLRLSCRSNLPDKKFLYLWTVIVTAIVHRGFSRWLPCHQITNFLDLLALSRGHSPYMILRLCGDLCFW